jgi:hypothetical protein
MSWNRCYTFLAQQRTAQRLGFVFGASQVIGFNQCTIENPGSSFMCGGIMGFVYGIGFEIVGDFCTPHMRVGLNSMLLLATGYKQFKNWRNPPLTFDDPLINILINEKSVERED